MKPAAPRQVKHVLLDARGNPLVRERHDEAPAHYPRSELLADLLYFHLTCARESAARLDRLPEWGTAYEAEFQVYRAAAARVREKVLELKSEGFGIPEDLLPLLNAEGLLNG